MVANLLTLCLQRSPRRKFIATRGPEPQKLIATQLVLAVQTRQSLEKQSSIRELGFSRAQAYHSHRIPLLLEEEMEIDLHGEAHRLDTHLGRVRDRSRVAMKGP
jgi:hypothetical protein